MPGHVELPFIELNGVYVYGLGRSNFDERDRLAILPRPAHRQLQLLARIGELIRQL